MRSFLAPLCAVSVLALVACSRSEAPTDAVAAPTASAPAAPSSQSIAERWQALPAVPLCGTATPAKPLITADPAAPQVGFTWQPVTRPSTATAYAVRISRVEGAQAARVLLEDLVSGEGPLRAGVGEAAPGVRYDIRVVAMNGETPLCVLQASQQRG
jgi:hypothetical protein